MIQINQQKSGFALLITLLTVSVIVAVTISLVELSRLQLRLAVDSRDAEIAFAAANAGMECAQRLRLVASSTIRAGSIVSESCFSQTMTLTATNISAVAGSRVDYYTGNLSWPIPINPGDPPTNRCTEIGMVSIITGSDPISYNVSTHFPNIADGQQLITCPAGAECTIISASGYNAVCAGKNQRGVLKRDVLLQF
jgi:hypothetical protein